MAESKKSISSKRKDDAPESQNKSQNQSGSGLENLTGALANLLERILDKGLVVNGKITINRLVLTSTDKGKEIGLVPDYNEMKQEQE